MSNVTRVAASLDDLGRQRGLCTAPVRRAEKPTLVYKVLSAGRKCGSEEEKRKAIEWAYKNIKPTDATTIGLYPRYSDQVSETTKMVREILA